MSRKSRFLLALAILAGVLGFRAWQHQAQQKKAGPHAHADVRHGYVQQFLEAFAPDAASDIAYLCGNPNMVDACFEALKAAGLPVPQIRREKYVSSK